MPQKGNKIKFGGKKGVKETKKVPLPLHCINILLINPQTLKTNHGADRNPQLKQLRWLVWLTYHTRREVQRTAERNSTRELRDGSTQFYTQIVKTLSATRWEYKAKSLYFRVVACVCCPWFGLSAKMLWEYVLSGDEDVVSWQYWSKSF